MPLAENAKIELAVLFLPRITPIQLARLPEPFDDPNWLFELKWDGFRAVAYVESGACRLVSRNGNTFKTFPGADSEPWRSRFRSSVDHRSDHRRGSGGDPTPNGVNDEKQRQEKTTTTKDWVVPE